MKNISVEQLAKDIEKFRGNLAAVARKWGISRQAIWKRVSKSEALQEACKNERESFNDNAVSVLQNKVLNGEPWAVCFWLKTQCRDRGFNERDAETLPIPLEAVLNELPEKDAQAIRRIISKAFSRK